MIIKTNSYEPPMNTAEEMRARVGQVAREFVGGRTKYGLIELEAQAIYHVRLELEAQLENDMENIYGNGPVYSAARLTLFNSIYR